MKDYSNTKIKRLHSEKILSRIQAGLFEPHRRKFARYLFFNFSSQRESDKVKIRAKLAKYAQSGVISSAKVQHSEFLAFQNWLESKSKSNIMYEGSNGQQYDESHHHSITHFKRNNWEPLIVLSLTSSGIQTLLPTTFPHPEDHLFQQGMYHEDTRLKTYDPDKGDENFGWEEQTWQKYNWGANREIDLMIYVADDRWDRLQERCEDLILELETHCPISFIFSENGRKIYDKYHKAIEPFGFRDGLSQIPFWTKGNKSLLTQERLILLDKYLGSYMVFRKLEQDTSTFDTEINRITRTLYFGSHPNTDKIFKSEHFLELKKYVEAQIFGRFKDGTPLVQYDRAIFENSEDSSKALEQILKFDSYPGRKENQNLSDTGIYQSHINRCPHFAHIRKTNPRESEFIFPNKKYGNRDVVIRIARRGIPYSEIDGEGVETTGLLFISYQASITNQFIPMMGWINDPMFPDKDSSREEIRVGVDPILGFKKKNRKRGYHWFTTWDKPAVKIQSFNLNNFITFKGGEYFYTPSLEYLAQLENIP